MVYGLWQMTYSQLLMVDGIGPKAHDPFSMAYCPLPMAYGV
jgi:hypothetical protein